MGVDRRRGAIFFVFFQRFGLGIGELQNFELVGVGKITVGRVIALS